VEQQRDDGLYLVRTDGDGSQYLARADMLHPRTPGMA
jgi:hypothetical protein